MPEQANLPATSPLNLAQEHLAIADVARPRLLVIDDDNLHRMIICRVAAKTGYAPAGAATFEEAVKLMRQAPFDCITLDLTLGDHGGIEMMRHLSDIGCKAPIIVVGGCDSATCRDSVRLAKSLNLNICEAIPKPVDLVVLRFWLERLKNQSAAAAATV